MYGRYGRSRLDLCTAPWLMVSELLILIALCEQDVSIVFIINAESPIISSGFTSNPTDTYASLDCQV